MDYLSTKLKVKQRKVLSAKQLQRVKFSLGAFLTLTFLQVVVDQALASYFWEDEHFTAYDVQVYERGNIVEFTNKEEFCHR